jgi:hypothetical protein
MKSKRKKPRVFIGLTEVSGYYSRLKKGFDELGVPAEFYSLQPHRFQYAEEKYRGIPAFARYCAVNRIKALDEKSFTRAFWLAMVLLSRVLLFAWAALKFDVFLLGGGSSFFRLAELPVLRAMGKKIIYIFHGTDSRPAYIDGFCEGIPPFPALDTRSDWPDEKTLLAYRRIARRRKRDVERIEEHAHVIVNAPPCAQFHTRPFVVSLVVGLPFDLAGASVRHSAGPGPVRILHCPSLPEAKGTREIREAIAALRRKGIAIDYVEVSNKTNATVLAEIERCDFVVDQVYSDTPMAAFAGEAAFYGKPAVVGGYYQELIKQDLKPEWIPPSLYCHPARIQEAIERMVLDRESRLRLGLKAKEFVERNWTAQQVAKRYLQMIEGDFPSEWLYEPRRNRYLHGIGMPEQRLRLLIRAMIKKFGRKALLLSHHPELEQRFVDFANITEAGC